MAIKRKPLDYESAEHLCNNLIKNKKKKLFSKSYTERFC